MKKYHIIHNSFGDKRTIHIVNDDEHPIIKKIECSCYHAYSEGVGDLLFLYAIDFYTDKTKEIKQKFEQARQGVPIKLRSGDFYLNKSPTYESAINQRNMDTIYAYIAVTQTIDPIPLDAFNEIMTLIPAFNVKKFSHHGRLRELVRNNQHDKALQLAVRDDAKGDSNIIIALANIYLDANVLDRWVNVLSCMPETNPNFTEANLTLFNYYQSLPVPNDKEVKIKQLEQKFKTALNAKLLNEAACFFDELCGNSGMNPNIKKIAGDPDSFIDIARERREEKNKYALLVQECKKLKEDNARLEKENKELKSLVNDQPAITSPKSPRLF